MTRIRGMACSRWWPSGTTPRPDKETLTYFYAVLGSGELSERVLGLTEDVRPAPRPVPADNAQLPGMRHNAAHHMAHPGGQTCTC